MPWRRNRLLTPVFLGFPCSSAGKESACTVGDWDSIPGLWRSCGEGNSYPLQYSALENFMNCIVHGVTKSQTQLSDFQKSEDYNCHEDFLLILLSHTLVAQLVKNLPAMQETQVRYIYSMEYYSAIKKNSFESVLVRWMKLEPIIQSEVSQKDKDHYSILTHIYGI